MGRPCGAGAVCLGRVAGRGSSSLLTGLVGGEMSGFERGAVAGLVGIEGGVVSGVTNLE